MAVKTYWFIGGLLYVKKQTNKQTYGEGWGGLGKAIFCKGAATHSSPSACQILD